VEAAHLPPDGAAEEDEGRLTVWMVRVTSEEGATENAFADRTNDERTAAKVQSFMLATLVLLVAAPM